MAHARTVVDADTTATHPFTAVKEDAGHKTTGIGAESVAVETTVISHITVGHTECVPIRANISGHQWMATRRTQYGVIICMAVIETAPDRSGQYRLIKNVEEMKQSNTFNLLCISIVDPPQHATIVAKADSGESNNY